MKDLLDEATQALRDMGDDPAPEARFTRARVLAGSREATVRSRTRLVFGIPIAATLMAATAFAGSGGRAVAVVEAVAEALGFSPPASDDAATARPEARKPHEPTRPAVASPPPPPDPAAEPASVEAPAAAEPARSLPGSTETAETRAAAVRPKTSTPDAGAEPAHGLYRAAHRAHFVEKNAALALEGWDAYLAAAPRGRFAAEARYNRAVCLVRLGRNGEAREALRPFAEGAFGDYRKHEASELLRVLPE